MSSSVGIGATSVTVQSGDGAKFPSPTGSDFFRLLLFNKITGDYEFVTVTNVTGDTLTCSATVNAYNAGDVAENRPSAAFYQSLNVTSVTVQQGDFVYAEDTGSADSYVVAMNPTATTLKPGQQIRVKIGASNTNTGAVATLKVDGLGAVVIIMPNGATPPAGVIMGGYTHTFEYNGTNFVLQSVGLALTSSGYNALAKKISNVADGAVDSDVASYKQAKLSAQFLAHEAVTPNMTVVVDAGKIQNGKTTLNVAQQTTSTITAPTTNPRIDLILIDALNGNLVVITGTESASPSAPVITSESYILIAEVLLQTSTTEITNSMIIDRRSMIISPSIDIFDQKVSILSSFNTTETSSWVTANAGAPAGARFAILNLKVYTELNSSSSQTISFTTLYIRNSGSSATVGDLTERVTVNNTRKPSSSYEGKTAQVEIIIKLDASGNFDFWRAGADGSVAGVTSTHRIDLSGYIM